MEDMRNGAIDILVGTQTITKGYHFPRVTLVGVVWADLDLHMPLYNGTEHALQQLIQVAGRAGRESDHARVIVQAMSEHPVFTYVNELAYGDFYQHEIQTRKLVGYPPCVRLAEIELKGTNEELVAQEAQRCVDELMCVNHDNALAVEIRGPCVPPVYKVQHVFARKMYLKSHDMGHIIKLFESIQHDQYQSHLFFTPNPVTL